METNTIMQQLNGDYRDFNQIYIFSHTNNHISLTLRIPSLANSQFIQQGTSSRITSHLNHPHLYIHILQDHHLK